MANFSKSFNFRNGVQVDNDKFIVKPTTGLVGIGSTVPTQLLDVAGNIKADGVVNSANVEVGTGITVGINSTIKLDGGTGRVTAVEYIGDGSTLTNVVAIATAGFTELSGTLSTTHSVGIGSTQPFDFKLDVIGAARVVGPSTFVGVTTVSDLFADALGVSGVSKLTGGTIVESGATINQANVTGVSTFGGDLTVSGTSPKIKFIDTDTDSDFEIINMNGVFKIRDITNNTQRFSINSGGHANFFGRVDANNRINVGGGASVDQLNVTGVSTFAGITTVTGSDLFTKRLNVAGVTTMSGAVDINAGLDVDGQTDLDILNVSETATFSALVDVNNRLDVVGGANIDQLNVTGVSTLTGRLTATEIASATGNEVKILHDGTQVASTLGAGVSVSNTVRIGSLNGGTNNLSTRHGELSYGIESGLNSYASRRSFNLVNTDNGNVNFYLDSNNIGVNTGNFFWHKGTGSQLMALTYDGKLGVGITTPDSPLHVAGNAKFGNDVTVVNDLVIGNDLNVTGGTINANVIGSLEGNVYAQTGVSTFANVVFADDLTVSGTTFSSSFGANTSSMLTVKPTNQATGGEGTIIRAVAGSNNYYLTNGGFVGIRTSDKFSNIIVNGSNANAVFQSFGVGSYDHFQSTQLQRGAVDFANAGVSTQRYMVPPKVTTTERNSLSGLVEGAMIYNTNNNRLEIYTQNSNWVGIATVA